MHLCFLQLSTAKIMDMLSKVSLDIVLYNPRFKIFLKASSFVRFLTSSYLITILCNLIISFSNKSWYFIDSDKFDFIFDKHLWEGRKDLIKMKNQIETCANKPRKVSNKVFASKVRFWSLITQYDVELVYCCAQWPLRRGFSISWINLIFTNKPIYLRQIQLFFKDTIKS